MNAAKQAVIADAERAGYTIIRYASGVEIVKFSKHKKPRVLRALRLYEDGVGFDSQVELSAAKAIRSAADMRSFLGI